MIVQKREKEHDTANIKMSKPWVEGRPHSGWSQEEEDYFGDDLVKVNGEESAEEAHDVG